jgi:transcriptional regulator with XRE-family HTH domain
VRDVQVGRAVRALRSRRGLTQQRLGALAGVSQATVSLVERGRFDRLALRTVRGLFEALDASAELDVRWRRGELDRLVDRRHAALVEATVRWLRVAGWLVEVEVSYAVYGERGSIDVLAFEPRSLVLLVVEVKSELAAVEQTVRKLDEKARHAGSIAAERFGWRGGTIVRLLVLPEATTSRRRVRDHEATFETAFPMRGVVLRRWLRNPVGHHRCGRGRGCGRRGGGGGGGGGRGGILFLPPTNPGNDRRDPRGPTAPEAAARARPERAAAATRPRESLPEPHRDAQDLPSIAGSAIWRDSRLGGAD